MLGSEKGGTFRRGRIILEGGGGAVSSRRDSGVGSRGKSIPLHAMPESRQCIKSFLLL